MCYGCYHAAGVRVLVLLLQTKITSQGADLSYVLINNTHVLLSNVVRLKSASQLDDMNVDLATPADQIRGKYNALLMLSIEE